MAPSPLLQLAEALKVDPADEIALLTGRNLRRLRTRRGYSLDRLAKISGVSRAMLGQIETGKSSPTISILSKIALALDVPCSSLIAERDETTFFSLSRAKSKFCLRPKGNSRPARCFRSRANEGWNSTS